LDAGCNVAVQAVKVNLGKVGMTMPTAGREHILRGLVPIEPEVRIQVYEKRTAIHSETLLASRRTQALKKALQRFDHLFT